MADRLKNIIEDIATDLLNVTLALRYDICTCDLCKNDILAYVLSMIPAKYVTTEEGIMRVIIEQTKAEHTAQIIREIFEGIKIVSKNPRHQIKEDKEEAFTLLLNKILQDRSLDFRRYRRELLKRRVAVRIRANKLNTYSEYLRLLINKPEEYDKLFEVLTINVSEFFRDTDVWSSLKLLFENLIQVKKKNKDFSIRIWSAGCANGEEPYSTVILLKDLLKSDTQFLIKVWGTDIDQKCLKVAQTAEYKKESLKNVSIKYLKTFFEPMGDRYRVSKEVRDWVKLENLDLINSPYLEKIDVILCRNVFIYFDRSLQEMLLTKFYESLVNGGYLIMGKVENILGESREIFHEVNIDTRIYQKKDVALG